MQTDDSLIQAQAAFIASKWRTQYGPDAIDEFLRIQGRNFTKYQDNPVGFINKELGIALTDDIAKMAESVRDNRITVARSATGTGKSHGASAIAIWFYKCFPNSRVYTTANPYENQKILWGELSLMATTSGIFKDDKKTQCTLREARKIL